MLIELCTKAAGFFGVSALLLFAWLCLTNIVAIQRHINERKRLEREEKR